MRDEKATRRVAFSSRVERREHRQAVDAAPVFR